MNKDHLNSLPPHVAVDTAYAQVSAVQDRPAAAQVAGAATLFLTMCEVLKLDVSEVLNKASRMARDDDYFYQQEIRALRAYIKGELAR